MTDPIRSAVCDLVAAIKLGMNGNNYDNVVSRRLIEKAEKAMEDILELLQATVFGNDSASTICDPLPASPMTREKALSMLANMDKYIRDNTDRKCSCEDCLICMYNHFKHLDWSEHERSVKECQNHIRVLADDIRARAHENDCLREALKAASVAINDWVVTYAWDMCDENDVREARGRMRDGVLAYTADVLLKIDVALGNRNPQPRST